MQTMTLEQVADKIESFDGPSRAGCDRDVYFLDDIVIKKDAPIYCTCIDCEDGRKCEQFTAANEIEYSNYQRFEPFTTNINGFTFHVKIPKMTLIGDYLIVERIRIGHVVDAGDCGCKCWDDYLDHESDCDVYPYFVYAQEAMCSAGFEDCHAGNWLYDEETCELWIIDAGE